MPKMTEEQVRKCLTDLGWQGEERDIAHGKQFVLGEDIKVNFYPSTGKHLVQGPAAAAGAKALVEEALAAVAPVSRPVSVVPIPPGKAPKAEAPRRVFVVYGHDLDARNDLERILLRMKLEPVILANVGGVGETIIERLENLTGTDFACVLLTPDDVGAAAADAASLRPRARQNVVLELGMVLTRLGRDRVAILVKGGEIEKPSDIGGLIYIPFAAKVNEATTLLGAALQAAGFHIDVRTLIG